MERIVITIDDDDEIDITAKSEGGDVETMTAPDMDTAVSIVKDLLMDATEDMDMDDMEDMDDDNERMQGMEASMDEDMPDMDEVEDMDEYEKTWNKEAAARAKEREMQDSYT
jgi:hypothetical protein